MKNTILVNGKRMNFRAFDNGGTSFDRYTLAFRGFRADGRLYYPYLGCSENPFHPQGCGVYGESKEFLKGKHLGKRIAFEDLPSDVQKAALQYFEKD